MAAGAVVAVKKSCRCGMSWTAKFSQAGWQVQMTEYPPAFISSALD